MSRFVRILLTIILLAGLIAFLHLHQQVPAVAGVGLQKREAHTPVLSSIWDGNIRQWSAHIGVVAYQYDLDPDLIAAVIHEESNGDHDVVSRAGAVGLMGVMPSSPGLEFRPTPEELMDPDTNLNWGVAILAEILRQSGGDFYSALAAYSGGWEQVNQRVPRQYAAEVLNSYGRAVAVRNGISPDIASSWTVAIEMRHGNVVDEPLLVLGDQPLSGLQVYGEHVIYRFTDELGRVYLLKAYAVPVALVVPLADGVAFGPGDALETQLYARLGQEVTKVDTSNDQVLMACLPSLGRLRGRVSTRWFAPSQCPAWHR